MQQQPKHILKHFSVRNGSIGKERRRNLTKQTLNKQIHFPKPVEYKDIDQAVFDWVDKDLELVYDGVKYPTYKLFSTQRISEYGQEWQKLDEKGNLEVNFKSITRENNPQKGDNQGNYLNIPGHREYPVFDNYVTNEDGYEHIERYTMEQPTSVNFIYTINLVTTSMMALNIFNNKIQREFNAIEKYLFPNGFAMPLFLNAITDESEYTIDDRKYYAQSFQVKLSGFIIRQEDYKVHLIPIRSRNTFTIGINREIEKNDDTIVDFLTNNTITAETQVNEFSECKIDTVLNTKEHEIPFDEQFNPISGHSEVEYEELQGMQKCWEDTEDEIYVNGKVKMNITFYECDKETEFELDTDLVLETINLDNIKDIKIYLNDDELLLEDSDIEFEDGDNVKIKVELENSLERGYVTLLCYDPNEILDMETDEYKIEDINIK